MAEEPSAPSGPDLVEGVAAADLPDGAQLLGHVEGKPVLLVRHGADVFAVGAECSHYGGPLAQGLVVGETIRCPWHHACFDLRTGEALRAPALSSIPCWQVEESDGRIRVGAKKPLPRREPPKGAEPPERIVIVGGGAAGFAAAQRLRSAGYQGSLTMLSGDDAPPVDRPNLSKDFLAGTAPEAWLPLRSTGFYAKNGIDLRLGTEAAALDTGAREVRLADGSALPYDRLLLATGAEPVRLPIPGADLPHVHTLRSLSDCRAIVARAETARRAVVIGASFIGLEVAAALRARKLEIGVVAPDRRPMERILGPEMGDFIRSLHEEKGVAFHLEDRPAAIDESGVTLESGGSLPADLVVVGVGVRPRLALAETAGLAIDRGLLVDAFLETSAPGVFAAGDIARWPDARTGDPIRVEHWAVALRQGHTAALNMLGAGVRHADVPFFWSRHYDLRISYVGHAEAWDEIALDGDIAARDCALRFRRDGRTLAIATVRRDRESLEAEAAMEREIGA
ncbi:FAD-dependent oxidoreductase [Amaricoccus sp.]|uniref:FAD-dependent oxidoreductase n=1 Tax=Amaricoccus sp. TaxID=1872485 RepID=UPI002639D9B9|nr:FAD-dependent oxidoreductase [Amaricoccus sp.]HRO11689.1 FAD-dependent oxidoreductase [Amaricoccus sp.]